MKAVDVLKEWLEKVEYEEFPEEDMPTEREVWEVKGAIRLLEAFDVGSVG